MEDILTVNVPFMFPSIALTFKRLPRSLKVSKNCKSSEGLEDPYTIRDNDRSRSGIKSNVPGNLERISFLHLPLAAISSDAKLQLALTGVFRTCLSTS